MAALSLFLPCLKIKAAAAAACSHTHLSSPMLSSLPAHSTASLALVDSVANCYADSLLCCTAGTLDNLSEILSEIEVNLGEEGISVDEWEIEGTDAAKFAAAFASDLRQEVEQGCTAAGAGCSDLVIAIVSIANADRFMDAAMRPVVM
eukprot:scaffold50697_cov13-Tisochrysis_lutea.AAC.1